MSPEIVPALDPYWQGTVDTRLENHDARFAVINGSIARHAKATEDVRGELGTFREAMGTELGKMRESMMEVRTTVKTWMIVGSIVGSSLASIATASVVYLLTT